jgi:DNA-directed RNA polymerase specialized sigma24 family protein
MLPDDEIPPYAGGPDLPAKFPTTQWTVVLAAGRTDSPQGARALERLCQTYWYPLYVFIRRRGHDAHTAQDLTQDFFAGLFERDALSGLSKERGRFRSFLLASLMNLLRNDWDKRSALKRGGGRKIISFDEIVPEERYRSEPVEGMTPGRLFERRWALLVIERVLKRLEVEHESEGKRDFFQIVRPFLTVEADAAARAQSAVQLNLSEGAFKVALHRFRRRFGELMRREVAHTVDSPEEVEAEIRHLLDVLCE